MNPTTPVQPSALIALEADLLKAHKQYCDAVILRNDHFLDIIKDYSVADITAYGTGRDEAVESLENLIKVAVRSKEQAPLELAYEFKTMNTRVMGNTAVVDGIVMMSFEIAGEKTTMDVRLSVVYEYKDNRWKAVHVHSSSPSSEQPQGESFPLDALKAKNEELQRLVEEKTTDLQHKNKELEIEAALERVRAGMMAMHKSEELRQVISSVFKQLQILGFDAPACALIIYNEDLSAEHWMSGFSQELYPESYKIPYNEHPYFTDLLQAWQKGAQFQEFFFEGDLKTGYAEWLFEHSDFKHLPQEFKDEVKSPTRTVISDAFMRYGMIEVISAESLPEGKVEIVKRFARVFEQTYTRFLDLKQAEAQAREAQIELGLERVRARAMAMQKSDELKNLVATVFDELTKLDIALTRCFIYLIDEKSASYQIWMLNVEDQASDSFHVQFFDQPYIIAFLRAWKERKTNWVYYLKGDEKTDICDHLFSKTELSRLPDIVKKGMRDTYGFFLSWTFFNFGGIQVDSIEPLFEASLDILSRFGKVFDLTYTRFNDLKQAEAQAREARIEAALEKVRSRTMAMQHSDELLDVVTVVREKMQELDVVMDGGVTILTFTDGSRDADHWVYNPDRFSSSTCSHIPYFDHPLYRDLFIAKESGIDFFSRISSFKETNTFWKYAFENTDFKYWSDEVKNWILASESFAYSIAFASNSAITVNSLSGQVISDEQSRVLKRFANVFDQAYVRFLDMQKAEANAKEAVKQASIDRVRAEIASMRSTSDLEKITPLIWDE